jgi:hypothetical protein
MDQADDIFMQVGAELRRQLAIVRTLVRALPRLLRRRARLEDRRNTLQQNPVRDRIQNENPDQAAQWGQNERELRQLEASNALLAAENARRLEGIQRTQAELGMLVEESRERARQDPELSAQLAALSPAEQDAVHSAVAGNIQAELHGDELVRRPDGSLMTRNEELQSLTADVRARVAQDPELSAQLAGLSPAEQDLVQTEAARGVQQELDRRFPDSRDPNYLGAEESERTQEALDLQSAADRDRDHNRVPDHLQDQSGAQDAARQREEQDEQYRQYVDPDDNGRDNAVEDREAERALRDQEAAKQKDQQRRQDLAEQERTEQGAEAAGPAAGAAAAVDELDDRAEDLDGPETDQARQRELNEPDAEQFRQQEGLDGADPGQVQGARGPEDGQGVDRDGAAQPVIGGDQQPGQDQQATSADQSGVRIEGQDGQEVVPEEDGSIRNATFTIHGQDEPETKQDEPGQDQQLGQPGQRPDPLDAQLAQARAENGRPTVRVDSIDGVQTSGEPLPDGVYKSEPGGGFSYEETPGGQDVRMNFGPGTETGGQRVGTEELDKLRAQQAGSPPPGSPRPEAQAAEGADAGQGARPDHALRAARADRGGRGQEGSGPERTK